MSYQGWKNYETWAVALWLGNEEGSYRYWEEVSQECLDEAEATEYSTRAEEARIELAVRLTNELGDAMPDLGATLWSDLLRAGFSEVDWNEIAKSWLEDKTPTDEESEEANV